MSVMLQAQNLLPARQGVRHASLKITICEGMEQRRRLQIVIDSKFRRFDRHPNSWHYVVGLPETLHNVVSLDLIRAFVPNTQQTVHKFNNVFQMTPAGSATVTVSLTPGSYEPALLLTAIQSGLQDAGVANPLVTLAPDTNLVTIQADQSFTLPFGSGDRQGSSIHRYLGFSNIDTQSATEVTGFYPLSLPPPTYVTVSVAEIPRAGCKRNYRMFQEVPATYSSRPELEEELFTGLIPFDCDYQTFKFFTASPTEILRAEISPVDIRQLTLDIRDDKGNPYDAGGYDHVLVFEVVTLEPPDLPLMCPGNARLPGPSPWGVQCQPFLRT